jgi:hypothetical protein
MTNSDVQEAVETGTTAKANDAGKVQDLRCRRGWRSSHGIN